MPLPDSIRKAVRRHKMFSPGQRVIVAVSGGPDSMALLCALCELKDELSLTLAVAHLDHGFRPESADEARFVADAAKGLGLPFYTERAALAEELFRTHENKQAAARRYRYAFLARAAEQFRAERIAVGHTADDQAETLLMRSIRGSGARGLSAIPPVRGDIVRPLIYASRAEVLAYLREKGVSWLTDPSNLKPVYMRNRLRLELLPVLEGYNPRIGKSLAQAADILRAEDDFLSVQAAELMRDIAGAEGGVLTLELPGFLALHEAMRRRVLRLAVGEAKGDLLGLDYGHIIDAERLISAHKTGKTLDLPGGIRVEISYERIFIYKGAEKGVIFRAELPVPGEIHIPEVGATVWARVLAPGEPPAPADKDTYVFDLDRLILPLVVRSRMPGDFFYPAGMEGRKKLKDYFIDEKIPRHARARVPVLVSGEDVVWLMGMRADGRFVAGPGSVRRVEIRYVGK